MLLTGPAIQRAVVQEKIIIRPFDPKLLNPNSYDCHLGDKLFIYRHVGRVTVGTGLSSGYQMIDSRNPPGLCELPQLDREEGGWALFPGRLYLGRTLEYTETIGFTPRIDGRSSTGRLGIFCHITAGLGDNGFKGTWTVELAVVEPVIIYPGQRLFQLTFETLEGHQTFYGETQNKSGRYQGQTDVRGAEPIE